MLLPNPQLAIIPPEKLRDYLLNPEHRSNRGKARLFAALGYTSGNWQQLAAELRERHLPLEAKEGRPNMKGQTYLIRGDLKGPRGSAIIMSVWQIDYGEEAPRFITAYRA